jgi:hypothetical protein
LPVKPGSFLLEPPQVGSQSLIGVLVIVEDFGDGRKSEA